MAGIRRYLSIGLAAALLCIFAAVSATPASADFSGRVTIAGGRHLYLECHGVGGPTVILITGLRGRGDVWQYSDAGSLGGPVLPSLAGVTRTCVYDRPGTALGADALSRSDPVPMPRTAADAVAELHALLTGAGVVGPYVLVGSSTGGLIARLYASAYPAEVAGMVLVDAISEEVQKSMPRKMFLAYNRRYLLEPSPDLAAYQDIETIDFPASFAQMRLAGARPSPSIPFFVISKGHRFGVKAGMPRGFSRALERAWRAGQRYLSSLSPRTQRFVATQSGHRIAFQQPELIIGAADAAIGEVRSH
jgi:pimeloyl-ACP methyl ester carboxylesterase